MLAFTLSPWGLISLSLEGPTFVRRRRRWHQQILMLRLFDSAIFMVQGYEKVLISTIPDILG